VTTLLVYAALGGLFFLLTLQLQRVLGYDPLAAGLAMLPLNVLMLLLSPWSGRLVARIGPRLPMTAGALAAGVGMLLFARVQPGTRYVETVLPAVLVFGGGLAVLVAPLTAAVLGAVDDRLAGVASALNNAVARLAGLLATAALPLAAGLGTARDPSGAAFTAGFARAMVLGAGLCLAGAAVAWATVRRGAPTAPRPHPHPSHACLSAAARASRA
jgi:MFS family permease